MATDTETQAQGGMTQTMIWIAVMIVVVGALAYFAT
jgi:hypothetical protein